MPAFMDPSTGQKRPSDASDAGGARKRQAVDPPLVETYWMVQWCASRVVRALTPLRPCRRVKQTKKHKTWDGDAVLVMTGTDARLVDTDGRLCAPPLLLRQPALLTRPSSLG
jgi:DNA repair and recombination protein RAD54B